MSLIMAKLNRLSSNHKEIKQVQKGPSLSKYCHTWDFLESNEFQKDKNVAKIMFLLDLGHEELW